HEAGVASVSAPVRTPSGRVIAAVSISGPIERLSRQPGRLHAATVIAGANKLTEVLEKHAKAAEAADRDTDRARGRPPLRAVRRCTHLTLALSGHGCPQRRRVTASATPDESDVRSRDEAPKGDDHDGHHGPEPASIGGRRPQSIGDDEE